MSLIINWRKVLLSCILSFVITFNSFGQTIPDTRTVNWTLAGYRGNELPNPNTIVNILEYGGNSDGITDNGIAVQNLIDSLSSSSLVIFFPAGNYFFNSKISLREGVVLRGAGANQSNLIFDLGGVDDLINVKGSPTNTFSSFTQSAFKNDEEIHIENPSTFAPGDYIRIIQTDSNLVFSPWAVGSVGQILKINEINGNALILDSELRKNFLLEDTPRIQKLNMIKNTGIECLKIVRLDETNPIHTSAIKFQFSAQSWIQGVESENCNFAHITIQSSTNITITGSYFHHAFDYGGGGRAYGVMIQDTGNENLIQNNVFEHLRHSMILQSGANGNVFGYNYSIHPFWTGTTLPEDSAGDLVCHGNYAYANLFEGNIGQQIVIDNSHGANGPYNTFVRNRVELYGIFISATNSPSQNFVGNEITNEDVGALGFYFLQGEDHFELGNNLVGEIIPEGTSALDVPSAYLSETPDFFQFTNFPNIGMPNPINTGIIPAQNRKLENESITICPQLCAADNDGDNVCNAIDNCIDIANPDQTDLNQNGIGDACETSTIASKDQNTDWKLYPNPTRDGIFLNLNAFKGKEANIQIISPLGEINFQESIQVSTENHYINLEQFNNGMYVILIELGTERLFSKYFVLNKN